VLALGHDDRGARSAAERLAGLVGALQTRGLRPGADGAAPLLALVGRAPAEDDCSTYLSRPCAVAGDPPAALVVRVVAAVGDESAPAAAHALVDGLRHAAATVYLGHLRYGVGPDFGPADDGVATDLGALAVAARAAARAADLSLGDVLERWRAEGRVDVDGSNASRVVLGTRNLVPSSDRARVEHWIASRGSGPPDLHTGDAGRTRRLWILLACRAARVFPELRRSVPPRSADLVGARDLVSLGEWHALPWLVDALCARAGWKEIASVGTGRLHPTDLVVDTARAPVEAAP